MYRTYIQGKYDYGNENGPYNQAMLNTILQSDGIIVSIQCKYSLDCN